jgi:acyl carrier protein
MSTERHLAEVDIAGRPPSELDSPRSAAVISDWCVNYLATAMELPPERIDVNATFASLGMDSVVRTSFQFALEELLKVPVTSEDLIERPTVTALADYLACNPQAGRGS